MATPTDSFKQFDYALRPSKQVERKIIMEILLRLPRAGFNISEYSYVGFGSVAYVDFVMFHKYLFIEKMVCIEWGDIEKRMRFNKPFKFIKLKLKPFSQYIPSIRRRERLLVWLDYDRPLDPEILQDIDGSLSRLCPTSIFIVTVDARPKLPEDEFDLQGQSSQQRERASQQRERVTLQTYRSWFGPYSNSRITKELVARAHVDPLFYEVILERIRQTLARQNPSLRFIQLFNFFYRDGAPMLTVGGRIGTERDDQALETRGIFEHRFVRRDSESLQISVPPLTIRETQWLNHRLNPTLRAGNLTFELEQTLLDNYRTFYRQYPTYLEALL
ncbi:O-methyltransferase [Candidatus Binatus soli]|jgi:hypothetical protein|uniref:O-methyltransferase n=1 Tax=Candidatus Binatus soli TaxID=1953413 RepID=UPI003D146C5D